MLQLDVLDFHCIRDNWGTEKNPKTKTQTKEAKSWRRQ